MTTQTLYTPWHIVPPVPTSLAESGLSLDLVTQLALKMMHFAGELTGSQLAARLGLPWAVIEPAMDGLKHQHHLEVAGGTYVGGASYRFRITDAGRRRAVLFLDANGYVGVAPVPLGQYRAYMRDFGEMADRPPSPERVRVAFPHLVIAEDLLDLIGPTIADGHSLFVYGEAGNGKTQIARGLRDALEGDIAVPHAIEVEGQIIRIYDPVTHNAVDVDDAPDGLDLGQAMDQRWIRCDRPLVVTGGELTIEHLQLGRHHGGYYKAPPQLLANGGVLVVDDFGRQRCSPRDLLNRWIVPLESRVDYLTLQTGQKFDLPFMVLVVFATNLKPSSLVDEAFLRRIRYKVYAEGPTDQEFRDIFAAYCRQHDVAYDQDVLDGFIARSLRPRQVELRGCHPRDLIGQALALAEYLGEPRQLTLDLLEAACATYFVDEGGAS
jgi:hypothetical protein